ncbi:hypothetical protein MA16_Dca002215 [Dendrobium catenatum]|uniref:SWIM-type domain-containing protein n=1 Tax=Dendrobium catenatum TaxID=906689 RepID=A0A2I0VZX0_9ASPA|nr:hypothetical protein MA16_Dca002215 [Dendrobium catenatum]
MEQRSHRKIQSGSWRGQLVPQVEEYIIDITTMKGQFIIHQSTLTKEEKDCSCGFWQLSGLPCIHSAAFIGTIQHSLWNTYVDDHYYVYRYVIFLNYLHNMH